MTMLPRDANKIKIYLTAHEASDADFFNNNEQKIRRIDCIDISRIMNEVGDFKSRPRTNRFTA